MLGYPVPYALLDQSLSSNLWESGVTNMYVGGWQNAKSRVAFFDCGGSACTVGGTKYLRQEVTFAGLAKFGCKI
jgi:hypothetical protein